MTVEQVQHLLSYLGYSPGEVDNLWGPATSHALAEFQERFGGIATTGTITVETEKALRHAVAYDMFNVSDAVDVPGKKADFWDEIEFFTREEFKCKCGGKYCNGYPCEPDEKMVRYADEIRRRLGVPLIVNSGLRCKVWNQKNNGATASKHMTGLACDLGAPKGITPKQMASVAEEVIGNTGGIGIYSWGIHIDYRPVKARWNG